MIDELPFVGIHLNNFYGIEIDDFPCEIARLSLWLAQHQINMECYEKYNNANPTLPLTASGHIVCGNALRLDWNEVCPAKNGTVYVCGNPPYAGGYLLDDVQRADKEEVLKVVPNNGFQDYISCWFLLGAKYVEHASEARLAFVTTNSITQGMQVTLWPIIFSHGVEIAFAYDSFKWKNNASHNAGVTVTIIGLQKKQDNAKYLYSEGQKRIVKSIGPYLVPDSMDIVTPKSTPISDVPHLDYGVKFVDDGNLILTTAEKESLINSAPEASRFLKKFIGADEFIQGKERWCLWIDDDNLDSAMKIPSITIRVNAVKEFRLKSSKKQTRDFASRSWHAIEDRFVGDVPAIIIPCHSSGEREYIPIGYLSANTVITNSSFAVYDAPLWIFSILTSRMHMAWIGIVAGRLGTGFRYSNTLCYNTFPFPNLSENQKKALEDSAMRIIEARENHYENTMAQLYDPDKMPDDLRAAHESNDLLVDSLYRHSGFGNDSERLQELFRRYKEATGGK